MAMKTRRMLRAALTSWFHIIPIGGGTNDRGSSDVLQVVVDPNVLLQPFLSFQLRSFAAALRSPLCTLQLPMEDVIGVVSVGVGGIALCF